MGEVRQLVKTFRVRMVCPKCGEGFMEPGDVVLTTYPPLYPHTCDHCGYIDSYRVMYPYIEYEAVKDGELSECICESGACKCSTEC